MKESPMRGTGNRVKNKNKPSGQVEQSQRFVEEARKLGVSGVTDEEFGRVFDVLLGKKAKPTPKSKSSKTRG